MDIKLQGKQGNRKITIINDADYSIVGDKIWLMDSKGYVYQGKRKGKRLFLHQFIMGDYPKGFTQIDHINGNKADNRRSNLRFCNNRENHLNLRAYKNNKSGFKGVQWHKQGKKWQARIYLDKKAYYLGLYDTAEEASKAYMIKQTGLYGEFANKEKPKG